MLDAETQGLIALADLPLAIVAHEPGAPIRWRNKGWTATFGAAGTIAEIVCAGRYAKGLVERLGSGASFSETHPLHTLAGDRGFEISAATSEEGSTLLTVVPAERSRGWAEDLEDIFADAPVGLALLNADGYVVTANRCAETFAGRERGGLVGVEAWAIATEGDRAEMETRVRSFMRGKRRTFRVDLGLERTDDARLWVEFALTRLEDDGEFLLLLSDVSARHRRERELDRLAHRDHLTGLANRAGLDAYIERLKATSDGGALGSLVVIDLDGFKEINDEHGHAVGDEALVAVARRLRRAIPSGDLAARTGGDEFLVISRAGSAKLSGLAERLRSALEGDIGAHGVTVAIGTSIGIAQIESGEDFEAAKVRADDAMYEDKRIRQAKGRTHARPAVVGIPIESSDVPTPSEA